MEPELFNDNNPCAMLDIQSDTPDVSMTAPEDSEVITTSSTEGSNESSSVPPNIDSDSTNSSNALTQRVQLVMQQKEAEYSNKHTERSYARHVKNYVEWWEMDQQSQKAEALAKGVGFMEEPAHPITAPKVILFLDHELGRNKKRYNPKEIANSNVGGASITQVITALENYRVSHIHDAEYQTPEAKNPLRKDSDIRRLEKIAREGAKKAKPAGVQSRKFQSQATLIPQQDYIQKLQAENHYLHQRLDHYACQLERYGKTMKAMMDVQIQTADPHKRKRLEDLMEDLEDMAPGDVDFMPPRKQIKLGDPETSSPSSSHPRDFSMHTLPVSDGSPLPSQPSDVAMDSLPVNDESLLPSTISATLQTPMSNSTNEGQPVTSESGRLYTWEMFPVTAESSDCKLHAAQVNYLNFLEKTIGADRLGELNETFEWVNDEWLPVFTAYYAPSSRTGTSPTLEDIWKEHTEGLNNKLSIHMLQSIWGSRWRRGRSSLVSEGSRRNKIVKLVETLSALDGWSVDVALKFLREQYPISSKSRHPHLRTSRAFTEYLRKGGGKEVEAEILKAAACFDVKT
ncbi:hypothetical protein CVT24_012038 [Panaeolus cyanescens]|uniref:Transcription activator GCR1-like domain-containing protein n=1 Tax=Panaeolus cyanescens TaxID=181874 RepID=A0A409VYG7_9AGAR|nr:hypothetical protein CVT24_012038 [Panaeolus cyanescens]